MAAAATTTTATNAAPEIKLRTHKGERLGPIIAVFVRRRDWRPRIFCIRERTSAAGVENGQDATAETAATSKTSDT